MSFELRCNGFSSQRFLCIGQSAYTDETMFFLLQRALMFHSSSTYHYLEQTWLYVFAVALERDLTICMDIERNPGPPCSLLDVHSSAVSFDSMPARHSFSTIPIGPVNGCQVVSPHCLVAPGYVAPTEVTSPQHRSCVAPTSKLRRPNA